MGNLFASRRRPATQPLPLPSIRLAVVVPAHDEAAQIAATVALPLAAGCSRARAEEAEMRAESVTGQAAEVFVVAHNCTDATADLGARAGARVVELSEPDARGKGAALRAGFAAARAAGAQAFLVVDAALFVALAAFGSPAILLVWLGPTLPMRHTLTTLFVVFEITLQCHMLAGPGTSLLRGMGRVYEEFSYSIPNVLLLAFTLPADWWIEKRWTALGIGVAVSVATAIAACGLLVRVYHLLGLAMSRFLTLVIVPGLVPFVVAACLAWPVAWAAGSLGRWTAAAALLLAGLLYLSITSLALCCVVFTAPEQERAKGMVRRALMAVRIREVAA